MTSEGTPIKLKAEKGSKQHGQQRCKLRRRLAGLVRHQPLREACVFVMPIPKDWPNWVVRVDGRIAIGYQAMKIWL
jgi:hypothetical protein